jgi:hypothetical protein
MKVPRPPSIPRAPYFDGWACEHRLYFEVGETGRVGRLCGGSGSWGCLKGEEEAGEGFET